MRAKLVVGVVVGLVGGLAAIVGCGSDEATPPASTGDGGTSQGPDGGDAAARSDAGDSGGSTPGESTVDEDLFGRECRSTNDCNEEEKCFEYAYQSERGGHCLGAEDGCKPLTCASGTSCVPDTDNEDENLTALHCD